MDRATTQIVDPDGRTITVYTDEVGSFLARGHQAVDAPPVSEAAPPPPPALVNTTGRILARVIEPPGRVLTVYAEDVDEYLKRGCLPYVEPEPPAPPPEDAKPPKKEPSRRRRKGVAAAADEGDEKDDGAETSLLGSSVQPSVFQLDGGGEVQLGEVVADAHHRSGLSVAAWNALDDEQREALIAAVAAELPLAEPEADAEPDAPPAP